jgi:hypothetical protein
MGPKANKGGLPLPPAQRALHSAPAPLGSPCDARATRGAASMSKRRSSTPPRTSSPAIALRNVPTGPCWCWERWTAHRTGSADDPIAPVACLNRPHARPPPWTLTPWSATPSAPARSLVARLRAAPAVVARDAGHHEPQKPRSGTGRHLENRTGSVRLGSSLSGSQRSGKAPSTGIGPGSSAPTRQDPSKPTTAPDAAEVLPPALP